MALGETKPSPCCLLGMLCRPPLPLGILFKTQDALTCSQCSLNCLSKKPMVVLAPPSPVPPSPESVLISVKLPGSPQHPPWGVPSSGFAPLPTHPSVWSRQFPANSLQDSPDESPRDEFSGSGPGTCLACPQTTLAPGLICSSPVGHLELLETLCLGVPCQVSPTPVTHPLCRPFGLSLSQSLSCKHHTTCGCHLT